MTFGRQHTLAYSLSLSHCMQINAPHRSVILQPHNKSLAKTITKSDGQTDAKPISIYHILLRQGKSHHKEYPTTPQIRYLPNSSAIYYNNSLSVASRLPASCAMKKRYLRGGAIIVVVVLLLRLHFAIHLAQNIGSEINILEMGDGFCLPCRW